MWLGDLAGHDFELAAGRLSEWLVCLISRRASVSVASSSNPLGDMGAEGATFRPVIRAGESGKKVALWEGVD